MALQWDFTGILEGPWFFRRRRLKHDQLGSAPPSFPDDATIAGDGFRFLPELQLEDRRTIQDDARYMALQGRAVSPEARALVGHVIAEIVAPWLLLQAITLRPSSRTACVDAVGAVLADLLHSSRQDRAASRSIRNESFSPPCPVGRTAFQRVIDAMTASGLLDVRKGHRVQAEGFTPDRDVATLYRPTPDLVALAGKFGIDLTAPISETFDLGKRDADDGAVVLVARAKVLKDHQGKRTQPRDLPIAPSDKRASDIRERIERLNAFLLEPRRVEGFSFGGLRRIFSNADQPEFNWQWGGRFSTLPGWDAYERWKGGSDIRGRIIQLEGEDIAEVDLSAAFLTILYGLLGVPFDNTKDPYATSVTVSRDRAKQWCNMALGAFKLETGGKPFSGVRKAFLERHPILHRLETCGLSNGDLQHHESEIILSAVEVMMKKHGSASLPVHDCLAVPRSLAVVAKEELTAAFHAHFRDVVKSPIPIFPRVAIKGNQGSL